MDRTPPQDPDPDETAPGVLAAFADIPAIDVIEGELVPRSGRD